MKFNRSSIGTVVASILLLSACVSKKKYTEAMHRNNLLEEQLTDNQTELAKYRSDYESTNNELSSLKQKSALEKSQYKTSVDFMQEELQNKLKQLEELQVALKSQRATLSSLKEEVCSALKCYAPEELGIEERDGKIYVSLYDELLFPSGGEQINNKGKEALTKVANVLAGRDFEILIEGHTDNVPINTARNRDNWDLSTHRANNVSRYLIEQGVSGDRIISAGRADNVPIKSNNTFENRQLNRRTEIILEPKLDKIWYLTESNSTAEAE